MAGELYPVDEGSRPLVLPLHQGPPSVVDAVTLATLSQPFDDGLVDGAQTYRPEWVPITWLNEACFALGVDNVWNDFRTLYLQQRATDAATMWLTCTAQWNWEVLQRASDTVPVMRPPLSDPVPEGVAPDMTSPTREYKHVQPILPVSPSPTRLNRIYLCYCHDLVTPDDAPDDLSPRHATSENRTRTHPYGDEHDGESEDEEEEDRGGEEDDRYEREQTARRLAEEEAEEMGYQDIHAYSDMTVEPTRDRNTIDEMERLQEMMKDHLRIVEDPDENEEPCEPVDAEGE